MSDYILKKGTDFFLCTGVHVQYQNSLVSK